MLGYAITLSHWKNHFWLPILVSRDHYRKQCPLALRSGKRTNGVRLGVSLKAWAFTAHGLPTPISLRVPHQALKFFESEGDENLPTSDSSLLVPAPNQLAEQMGNRFAQIPRSHQTRLHRATMNTSGIGYPRPW